MVNCKLRIYGLGKGNILKILYIPMQTTQTGSGEDPSWLKSPKDEQRKNGRKSGAASDAANGSRVSTPLSSGRGRRSYGGGYDSAADDDDMNYNEDCCCCPMDPILLGIVFFHGICLCLGLSCIAINIHHLTHSFTSEKSTTGHVQDIICRTYMIIFAIIMIICEVDWRFIMRRIRILDLWIFRGFFYIYIGIQTIGNIDEFLAGISNTNTGTTTTTTSSSSLDNMIGTVIVVSGIIYVGLGICCIKSVAENRDKARRDGFGRAYREIREQDNNVNIEMESV